MDTVNLETGLVKPILKTSNIFQPFFKAIFSRAASNETWVAKLYNLEQTLSTSFSEKTFAQILLLALYCY